MTQHHACRSAQHRYSALASASKQPVSYATAVVTLGSDPVSATALGREYVEALAQIRGKEPVNVLVRAYANGQAAKAFMDYKPEQAIVVSGEIELDQPDGNMPVLITAVIAPATPEQYLNEVVVVGRIGSEAREAESGKSAKRSVAVNRYYREAGAEEVTEVTDWFGVRGFGLTKERLEAIPIGSLVEVNGSLSQMTSSKGAPYSEVKARSVKVHKAGTGGSRDLASGTATAGYDQATFEGQAGDCPPNW